MAQLSGTTDTSTANVVISTVGTTDWWHPIDNLANAQTKSGGGSLITWVTPTIGGVVIFYNGSYDASTMSWVGGTPNATGSDNGVLYFSANGGFHWTIPADTSVQTLDCFFGTLAASGGTPVTFTATLSDGSAGPYTVDQTTDGDWNIHLTFQAASAGQTLTVELTSNGALGLVRGIGLSVAAGGNTMTVAATVPVATSAASLASTDNLAIAATVPVATSAIALGSTDSLTVAATVPVATSAATVVSSDVLTIAATVPVATMAAVLGTADYVVTVAATVPPPTSAASLASTDVLTVAATVPVATMAAAMDSTDVLAIAAVAPVATMAANLTAGTNNVAVDAVVPVSTMAATLASTDAFGVVATVPGPSMAASLAADLVVVIAAISPVPTMVATLTIPVVAPPVTSPWAKLMKPRYARWRRRSDGIV